jgi:hypothetical protein
MGASDASRDAGDRMTPLDLREAARRFSPAVPDLSHLRAPALATWRGRMVNEYASSRVFGGLAAQIRAAGLDAALATECEVFAEEERTHGALCGAVVQALGGEAVAPARHDAPFPMHADVPAVEGVLRNIVSISCLSETVAVSLIGAERLAMPDGDLRDLLTRIWADEIGHARFGWRFVAGLLPTTGREARTRLDAYLAVAFAHLERHELAHLVVGARPPAEGAALGLCDGADARTLFYATVCEVIVPRLEALGVTASRAWATRGRPERSCDAGGSVVASTATEGRLR